VSVAAAATFSARLAILDIVFVDQQSSGHPPSSSGDASGDGKRRRKTAEFGICFADQPPSAASLPWTVSTGAKNAFIWLCLQGLVTLGADYK